MNLVGAELTVADERVALDPMVERLIFELGSAFAARGHELYLVGGAVRDAMLGKVTRDLDFATDARPETSISALEGVPHDAVYRIGEKFGTVGAVIGGDSVEITTYRSGESYPQGSRKPAVTFGTTLEEDLMRRDFTVNAMARAATGGPLIDPFGGQEDLAERCIRTVGDAGQRFTEDPLRLLRAIRFAAQLGFAIADETWRAIEAMAGSLREVSRERIADEYARMLVGPDPARAMTLLRESGLMACSVPQLLLLDQMPDHGPNHPLSLWDHTMRALGSVPPDLPVRWAALLHDIGKPQTRSFEPDGRIRFFHHEEVGARIARDVLTSLRASRELTDAVVQLVETHMQLHAYTPEWSDGAVRRLCHRLGSCFDGALALARADASAHSLGGPVWNLPKFDHLEARARALALEPAEIKSSLDGNELMARYGRGPGPWLRTVKDALRDMVLDGDLAPGDRDGAWRAADEIVASLH